MTAELKSLMSSDVDIFSYVPDEPDKFRVWIRAMIGPTGDAGSESFDFEVVSVGYLAYEADGGVLIGRHKLIANMYDLTQIEKVIKELCSSVSGDSWMEIAQQLSRFGKWEFEDYRAVALKREDLSLS